ncbi:MAG: hypothetical protein U9R32_07430 [Bacteroidota bacterium]|nr:hypothetical protein [Bacteroidota bacterium]
MLNKIETEEQYKEAVKRIEELDGAPEGSPEDKELQEIFNLVEEYEDNATYQPSLFSLQKKMDKYSDKEIIVYQKMANQYIDYSKKLKAGEKAKKPKFDKELIAGMREWAILTQDIARLEKENK